jgi:hypothetical protein
LVAEEKGSSRTIKVVDRRRFTTDGEPREDVTRELDTSPSNQPSSAPPSTPSRAARSEPAPSADVGNAPVQNEQPRQTGADGSAATSPEFVELIASLAQQAEILLVGAEGVPADPDQARRIIDYLAALESKTAGNVSSEEQQILSNVIFQLRSIFLQRR